MPSAQSPLKNLAAICLLLLASCTSQKTTNFEIQTPPQNTLLPQAKLPTIKVDEKENQDVYLMVKAGIK